MVPAFETLKPSKPKIGDGAPEFFNPYAVGATTIYKEPKVVVASHPGQRRWLYLTAKILAIGILLGALPAAAFAYVDVQSIVASGGILGIASILLLGCSIPRRTNRLLWIAVPQLVFILSIFALIVLNQWSPAEAQNPVANLCGSFALLLQCGWFAVKEVGDQ